MDNRYYHDNQDISGVRNQMNAFTLYGFESYSRSLLVSKLEGTRIDTEDWTAHVDTRPVLWDNFLYRYKYRNSPIMSYHVLLSSILWCYLEKGLKHTKFSLYIYRPYTRTRVAEKDMATTTACLH